MAEAVVDRLEVVDVGDHEREARPVPRGALELVLEPGGQGPAVGEARQSVRVCLPRQARDVADHLCERPGELARERRGEQERDGGGEEDEAPVALGESIDRRDRLDGHEGRACRSERRRLRGEGRSAEVDAAAA